MKKLSLFPEDDMRLQGNEAGLLALRSKAAMCQKCDLHECRRNDVFGVGNTDKPDLAFVGEGPGAAEDETGLPFAGSGGALLDQMLSAIGYTRADVYLCNIVICRTPGTRRPEDSEIAACSSFLTGQMRIVQPKVIIALGATAAQALANSQKNLNDLRGRWLEWRDKKLGLKIPLRATYHPSYLLRHSKNKSDAWKDLQIVAGWVKG
jgi:DNA polymerase